MRLKQGWRPSLLLVSSWRYWRRSPLQAFLAITGIALGVAVVIAVALANASALKSFSASTQALQGSANARILADDPHGLPDSLYVRLRLHVGLTRIAPIVAGYIRIHGETLRLIGFDPFAQWALAPRLLGGKFDLSKLLIKPNTVLMTPDTAKALGVSYGQSVEALIDGRSVKLNWIGTPGGDAAALRGIIFTDIATAQDLLNKAGRLSYIDVAVAKGQFARLREVLPDGTRLVSNEQRLADASKMTRAFRLNLLAMSGLALLIGAYLIYNTLIFSVIRRRPLIGLLRAQGVTRGEIIRGILAESTLLALLGAAFGVMLGILLGHGLVRLVIQTINELYFTLSVEKVYLDPLVFAESVALALIMVLVAALPAASEAARLPPRGQGLPMRSEALWRRNEPWRLLAGFGLLGLSGIALGWPNGGLFLAFLGLFLAVIGATLWVPAGVRFGIWVLGRLSSRASIVIRLTIGNLHASLSRTGLAVMALSVALAASIGVGMMVGSFRFTLIDWLHQSLRGDIYVDADSGPGGRGLSPTFVKAISDLPSVSYVTTGRHARVSTPVGKVSLLAVGTPSGHRPAVAMEACIENCWQAFSSGKIIWISQPLANRLHLKVGSRLSLDTASGPHFFKIGGIFYDYGGGTGLIMMSRTVYAGYWNDPAIGSIAIYVRPKANLEDMLSSIRARASLAGVAITVKPNKAIVANALRIFDNTFEITRVLRLLLLGVAMVGLLSAWMAWHLEHQREQAILRALGVTPRGLFMLISAQSTLLGALAGLASMPLGLGMAWVLVAIINPRAFGWTLSWHNDPLLLLQAVAAAIVAAWLAALWPAWRVARTSPAKALKSE